MIKHTIKSFLHLRKSSEFLLLFSVILAIAIANSNFFDIYKNIFLENIYQNFSLKFFIDDFLMSFFFLLIGLELKNEVLHGELSSRKKALLPIISAVGGVVFPCLIFMYFNIDEVENINGFAIAAATDIAFAYAIIKAFGKKISHSIKIFLISLAIFDDIIAIFIIGFFYTKNIDFNYLFLCFLTIFHLLILNKINCKNKLFYAFLGLILWFTILKSSIHPAISGAVLAVFIPNVLIENFSKKISKIVSFFILPIFAFANCAISFDNFSTKILYDNLFLGIVFGLFFGKQIGILLFSFLSVKLKICEMPKNSNWLEFYCASILAGIGFTMSLFIANLAFVDFDKIIISKMAILFGSLLSVFFAIIILFIAKFTNKNH